MSDKLIYQQNDRDEITLADLYPELPSEQRSEAEYRLLRYFGIVKGIFERIAQENPRLLTELERRARLRRQKMRSGKP